LACPSVALLQNVSSFSISAKITDIQVKSIKITFTD
jgi:hypothetical protein